MTGVLGLAPYDYVDKNVATPYPAECGQRSNMLPNSHEQLRVGSGFLGSSYQSDNVTRTIVMIGGTTQANTIWSGWHHIIYVPHRNGVASDSSAYGLTFYIGLHSDTNSINDLYYCVHHTSGVIWHGLG